MPMKRLLIYFRYLCVLWPVGAVIGIVMGLVLGPYKALNVALDFVLNELRHELDEQSTKAQESKE